MPIFEMIGYHNKTYPVNIPVQCEELAGHFDVMTIASTMAHSLHTEYCYGKRAFRNDYLSKCPAITEAQKNGIPQLWHDKQWADEFAHFVLALTKGHEPPKYIEIHPPFTDYTGAINEFVKCYSVFEEVILSSYPNTIILIENRCGSLYKGGRFTVSKVAQIIELVDLIIQCRLKLRVTLDIPQLYTAHDTAIKKDSGQYVELLRALEPIREYILGVHLWGKRISDKGAKLAHVGELNSYFDNNQGLKDEFLAAMHHLFDDQIVRNMVLEVNSGNNDMMSILHNLMEAHFNFI